MIEVTVDGFINTLVNAISSSPTSFVTLIAGIIFLIAMLISIKKYKKIGKTLFIVGWLFVILFIIFKYSNNLTTLLDNFVNNVFMQIFFPNLATYVIIIAITNFVFLFTILNSKSKMSNKVINSLFFSIIMLLLILVLDVIFTNEINIYEKLTVYSNQTLLILIEATTIIFVLWFIILGSKAIVSKLIRKSDKKVKDKYNEKENETAEAIPEVASTEAKANITEAIPEVASTEAKANIAEAIPEVASTEAKANITEAIPEVASPETAPPPTVEVKPTNEVNEQPEKPQLTNEPEPLIPENSLDEKSKSSNSNITNIGDSKITTSNEVESLFPNSENSNDIKQETAIVNTPPNINKEPPEVLNLDEPEVLDLNDDKVK